MKVFKKVALIIGLIYLFLLSIKLMGVSFKMIGGDFSSNLVGLVSNPFLGLFVGLLVTSIVQSSSFTTSLVVTLVAAGVLDLSTSIPIIMGANIGTTVTNTLVSLAHISWKHEFKKAFAAATIHDFFNLMTVAILFPLELKFGLIEKFSISLGTVFEKTGGVKIFNPMDFVLSPANNFLKFLIFKFLKIPATAGSIILAVLALFILFCSLYFLVKVLKSAMRDRLEILLDRYLFRNAFLSMLMGFAVTAVVQSSSITTSLIVPLAGAGVLTLEKIFPYTLGANVGTTMTAILASLATGNLTAVTVSFAHLIFNLLGIAIFYPLKRIPIGVARWMGEKAGENRTKAIIYLILFFYVVPVLLIFVFR